MQVVKLIHSCSNSGDGGLELSRKIKLVLQTLFLLVVWDPRDYNFVEKVST